MFTVMKNSNPFTKQIQNGFQVRLEIVLENVDMQTSKVLAYGNDIQPIESERYKLVNEILTTLKAAGLNARSITYIEDRVM